MLLIYSSPFKIPYEIMMQYINIKQPGGPEVLELSECEIPTPGKDQILIKIAAADVNRPDVIQGTGNYPPSPGASEIPELEIAGEIIEVNGSVGMPTAGDTVCALIHSGGYAEYAIADAALCLPIPNCLTAVESAAIPEPFFTVWSNIFDRGQLKAGETLLVHGGSSGTGTAAIQFTKAFDAKVYITAGSNEKCDVCMELGANLAINYKESDFVEMCKEASNSKGVNLILDMIADEYINKNIALAAVEGRIVIIAALAGFKITVNFQKIMLNRLTITGSTLRPRSTKFRANIAENLKENQASNLQNLSSYTRS